MVGAHDLAVWRCHLSVAKFHGDWMAGAHPYEVLDFEHNMLLHGGVSVLWQALLGNGTTTAGQALTYLSNAQAAIGVGDGTAAAVATQTNLQGTNRLRKAMEAGYPQHTDGTTSAAKSVVFRSLYSTSQANFAWEEAGVFNSATDGVGRMLNRKVQSMGTKTSANSWQATFTIALD